MPSPEDCGALRGYFEGVEAVREEIETKWGAGRAEKLAGDDLRARFRRQQATWSQAYQTAWEAGILTRDLLEAVQQKAAAMQRGWLALDQAAEAAGHRPIRPWVWEVMLADGSVAALVQTEAEVAMVQASGRFTAVYTAVEIGHLLDAIPGSLQMAKAIWPGAKFQAANIGNPMGAPEWSDDGDEIPFGDPQQGRVR
jgi:hypothetical protein